MQTPFAFDEDKKEIYLSADSLEAWVSVITNAKKLSIASEQLEDKMADKIVKTPTETNTI